MDSNATAGVLGIIGALVFWIAVARDDRGPRTRGKRIEAAGMVFAGLGQLVALALTCVVAFAVWKLVWLILFRW